MRKACLLMATALVAFSVVPMPALAESASTDVILSLSDTDGLAPNGKANDKLTERVQLDGNDGGHDAYQTGLASPLVTAAAGSAFALGAASAALGLSKRRPDNEVA